MWKCPILVNFPSAWALIQGVGWDGGKRLGIEATESYRCRQVRFSELGTVSRIIQEEFAECWKGWIPNLQGLFFLYSHVFTAFENI